MRLDGGWRLALAALAWLAGIGVQLQQLALWPIAHYQGLSVLAAALLVPGAWMVLRRGGGASRGSWPVLLLGLALLAFASTGWAHRCPSRWSAPICS